LENIRQLSYFKAKGISREEEIHYVLKSAKSSQEFSGYKKITVVQSKIMVPLQQQQKKNPSKFSKSYF
jgi:hypothetical protein